MRRFAVMRYFTLRYISTESKHSQLRRYVVNREDDGEFRIHDIVAGREVEWCVIIGNFLYNASNALTTWTPNFSISDQSAPFTTLDLRLSDIHPRKLNYFAKTFLLTTRAIEARTIDTTKLIQGWCAFQTPNVITRNTAPQSKRVSSAKDATM